jgi:hypothetical protein
MRTQRFRLVFLVLLGLIARPALATTTLPEVLLVVDTSASMQYRVGGDELPLCGSTDPSVPDQRSRWNAAREIIGGSFSSFTCQYEALPSQSEVTTPPAQQSGAAQCIAGLPASIGSVYSAGGSGDGDVQAGSAGWAGTSDPSGNMILDDSAMATTVIPWVRFNLTSVLSKQTTDNVGGKKWTGASLTLNPSAVVPASGFNAALVLLKIDPTTSLPKPILCEADILGRNVVSLPAQVQAGQATTFSLTSAGVDAIQALTTAGTTHVALAVVPIGTVLSAACTAQIGTPSNAKIVWNGGLTAARPRLDIVVGLPCPDEGPGKHSTAYAIQNDGTKASKSTGLDGILDVFGPVAKFALLAGDGVLNKAATAAGGYSFGNTQSSLWGEINLGQADPSLGGSPSVPVTGPDTSPARVATASAIQSSLAAMRPNGPTPLGDQLADAYDYLFDTKYQDPHFRTQLVDPVNGDPYLACRPHIVVVLSDGGANLHTGSTDGRSYAVQQAGKLFAKGVQVFVLAVGHPRDVGQAGPSDADLAFLNDVAAAGGSVQAVPVQTPQGAVTALAPAIAKTSVNGEVLTRPIYTTSTGIVSEVEHSFDAMSVFDISQPLRTRGVVEQRIFKCGPECKASNIPNRAQVCKILDYQQILANRTVPRRIYSHAAGARIDADSTHLTPGDLGIGTLGAGPKLVLQPDSSCVTSGAYDLSIPAEREGYRDHVLDTMRAVAGTCRQNFPLGAPAKAQPALLEPARRIPLRDPTFLSYANATVPSSGGSYSDLKPPGSAGRATMLFVATHDGLLHAFRTDNDPKINVKDTLQQGDEMWAWLPRFNLTKLSQMKLVTSAAASTLGGAVVAGHVLLNRASSSASDTAKNWRAVVVVGAGESGSGYTALDVTAPDDPQLLWEITPTYHCFGNGSVSGVAGPQCLPLTTYQALGRSTAKAALASLFYARPSELVAEHAVAIIPMGKAPGEATVANLGTEGLGERGVFVVDLETGALVKAFKTSDMILTGMPSVVTDTNFLGHAWSDIACYNNGPGQITTRCFQGDSKGVLWRLDLSSQDPTRWTMQYFFDAYAGPDAPGGTQLAMDNPGRVPIVSPPSLALTQTGQLAVLFGTGGVAEDATLVQKHVAYSLTEVFQLAGDGSASTPSALLNWVKTLGDYERFVGPATLFASNAYWSTYTVVKTGSCDVGSARLWGGRFDRPKTPSDVKHMQGAFPDPTAPSLSTQNLESLDLGGYQPSPVDIEPVPACNGGCSPTDAKCVSSLGGQLGGARPQYQIGVQVAGNVQGQYQTPKTGTQPQVGTITRDIVQPRTAAVVTGWDMLLD